MFTITSIDAACCCWSLVDTQLDQQGVATMSSAPAPEIADPEADRPP